MNLVNKNICAVPETFVTLQSMKNKMHIFIIVASVMLAGSVSGADFNGASVPVQEKMISEPVADLAVVACDHFSPALIYVVNDYAEFAAVKVFTCSNPSPACVPMLVACDGSRFEYAVKIVPAAESPGMCLITRTGASHCIPSRLGGKPDTKRHFAWLAPIIKLC
jgi:hypothetical protein